MRGSSFVIIICLSLSICVSLSAETPQSSPANSVTAVRNNQTRAKQPVPSGRDGDEKWQRIVDERHEWEGDIEALAGWTLQNYGGFLAIYPNHPRAGDALFRMAEATWALGGYPEVVHYILEPGTREGWLAKKQHLEQWFDTRGFGGGPIGIAFNRDPKRAVEARQMFLEVPRDLSRVPICPNGCLLQRCHSGLLLERPASRSCRVQGFHREASGDDSIRAESQASNRGPEWWPIARLKHEPARSQKSKARSPITVTPTPQSLPSSCASRPRRRCTVCR